MRNIIIVTGVLVIGSLLVACVGAGAADQSESLVIYSGRSESLVGPLVEQFEEASGIDVQVRWGGTAELAATLLEEGDNSPADVFFAQDPGGLGAVAGRLDQLPAEILGLVDPRFRDRDGRWVGISSRARTVVYNTATLTPADLPADLWGFTDPRWRGRIGWAPTNASFQTMVTGMRAMWGDAETRRWLVGILANEPVVYEKNTPIVAAVGAGEVAVGFVNHYYLFRFLQEEGEGFPARNYYFTGEGPGNLVMVAGLGILETAQNQEAAQKFIRFMLSPVAQQYFATQTFEYPVTEGVITHRELPTLDTLAVPGIELSALTDLQGTVALLREVGALP